MSLYDRRRLESNCALFHRVMCATMVSCGSLCSVAHCDSAAWWPQSAPLLNSQSTFLRSSLAPNPATNRLHPASPMSHNGNGAVRPGGIGSGSSLGIAKSAPLWYCLFTCCLYGFGSGSMSFFNKALVSSLVFSYSNALLTMQMGACVLLFQVARATGWSRFTHPQPKPGGRWGRFELYVRLLPLSLAYCGNAMAGMLSLQGLSLPMYSVLKRFTPLLVAAAEFVLFGKRTSRRVLAALALCMIGFILAGLGDLVFDARAYALAMISCASQGAYMISVDHVGRALEMQSHELLYYNSLLSLLVILPWVVYTGEMQSALFEYAGWSSPLFLFALSAMILLGMSLNYTMFLCTQVSAPSLRDRGHVQRLSVSVRFDPEVTR